MIPAYEYSEGVARILDALISDPVAGVECIIGDDSHSEHVQRMVESHPAKMLGRVEYLRNVPSNGAVANWNGLLGRARGDFILFMHHDECPLRPHFFGDLRRIVEALPCPSHVLLDCVLPVGSSRIRSHVPRWLRQALLRVAPTHLLRHNTLGPPSAFVVKRTLAPRFKEDLRWLVDVDWYLRSFAMASELRIVVNSLAVISLPQDRASITATLADSIPLLARQEAELLELQVGRIPVIRLMLPRTPLEMVADRVERTLWITLRVLLRIASRRLPTDAIVMR